MSLEASDIEDARGRMEARDVSIDGVHHLLTAVSAPHGFSNSRAPGDRRAGEGAESARVRVFHCAAMAGV